MLRIASDRSRHSVLRGASHIRQRLWVQEKVRFLGISRHAHERWSNEEEPDDITSDTEVPTLSPDDMELYNYNPESYLQQHVLSEEKQEEEEKRQKKVRDELDMRKGRGWTDPWEITDEEWSSTVEYDDLPSWTPASASKLSLDRVQVFDGGIPTLDALSKLKLPTAPPPHPGSGEAKAYAAFRKDFHYKSIHRRVVEEAEPQIEEIKKLSSWEEKQDAVDELFESIEFKLKSEEEVLGRNPHFGQWVEGALEECLTKIQAEVGESDVDVETEKDCDPIFMDLFDASDESEPMVPEVLHPLAPHPHDGEGRMVEEWELSAHKKTKRIMLRESTQEIARALIENESSRVFVNGEKGVGKTAALLSIVASARKSGHIVLFVPDGDRLRKHGYYIEPNSKLPGLFDLPVLSQEMCSTFLKSHRHDLAGMSASESTREKFLVEDMKKRMSEEQRDDLSLVGLLELGRDEAMFAPMAFSTVIEALMSQEDKPFLVVLDEFNCYYDHGHYFHGDYDERVRDPIPLDRITLFKPFLDAVGLSTSPGAERKDDVPIKRGGIVAGISENRAVARQFTDRLVESARMAAASNSHDEFPLRNVTVPRYSMLEVEHILSNFDVVGIGRLRFDRGDTVIDDQEVAFLRMVSGSNGQLLLNACIV